MKKEELYFSSGIPALNDILQGIWKGDNVVCRVDHLEDYRRISFPFCRWTKMENRKLIYFRFADHEPLVPDDVNAEIHHLEPRLGFEKFIKEILNIITEAGIGACYVFDCLSGLAVDWFTDQMLANFFRITCPYLYKLDTVAYFVLMRNRHTPLAVNAIHNTAQVVMDIFRSDHDLYILPLKVYKRSSPTMYMLHSWKEDELKPVMESPVLSRILTESPQPWLDFNIHRRDTWTDTFIRLQEAVEKSDGKESEELKKRVIRMIITRDERFYALSLEYFELEDLLNIGKRLIGTGLVGGKSVGMLVARAILKKKNPDWNNISEPHDSFFIGSDVFYTFVIRNKCWWERHELAESGENIFKKAEVIRNNFLEGDFPRAIMADFEKMLHYFGQSPIIVRSSSLLEDAYGNAFSGKYESVFCPNQGSPGKRMEEFLNAVRTVYASAMSPEALSYRQHWGLLKRDEQMALLVQRVSGSFFNGLYYPQIAGVAYSYNPFVWNEKIDPAEGVIRLVYGLGTRAVDRHDDDYTRIVALNHPGMRPEGSGADIRDFSQRKVDLIDLEQNKHTAVYFEEALEQSKDPRAELFSSKLSEIEKSMTSKGEPRFLTFNRLLNQTGFLKDMKEVLQNLQAAYDHPVDMEFSANFLTDTEYKINVLQCRPFQYEGEINHVSTPQDIHEKDMILKTAGPIIGGSAIREITRIIYIVPSVYGKMSMQERYGVASLIGKITAKSDKDEAIMLIGPGRWGTRMPALGVPVKFREIMNVSVLCEVVTMHDGLTPDFSFGTHFFNDLVEMKILYMGVFPNKEGNVLDDLFLKHARDRTGDILESEKPGMEAVRVLDSKDLRPAATFLLHSDSLKQEAVLFTHQD